MLRLRFCPGVASRLHCVTMCTSATLRSTSKLPNSFYMAVHPDFFGHHPTQQKVNEDSLKLLHSYLNGLNNNEHVYATTLTFFVKSGEKRDSMYEVRLRLEGKSISKIVSDILRTCHLENDCTKMFSDIVSREKPVENALADIDEAFSSMESNIGRHDWKATPTLTLGKWLVENKTKVELSQRDEHELNKGMSKVIQELNVTYGVKRFVRDESQFSNSSLYHTLKHLLLMLNAHHPHTKLLQGRTLTFGLFNGLDQLGKVVFNLYGLPSDWNHGLSSISDAEASLEKINLIEQDLRELCCGANFVRPRTNIYSYPAPLYLQGLERIKSNNMVNASHSRTDRNNVEYKDITCTLNWHIDVIAVSREGCVQVPSCGGGEDLLQYLKDNAAHVRAIRKQYLQDLSVEYQTMLLCKSNISLRSLEKDSSINRLQTVTACNRLNSFEKAHLMRGWSVVIGKYYSITKDGLVRIPWNFVC